MGGMWHQIRQSDILPSFENELPLSSLMLSRHSHWTHTHIHIHIRHSNICFCTYLKFRVLNTFLFSAYIMLFLHTSYKIKSNHFIPLLNFHFCNQKLWMKYAKLPLRLNMFAMVCKSVLLSGIHDLFWQVFQMLSCVMLQASG